MTPPTRTLAPRRRAFHPGLQRAELFVDGGGDRLSFRVGTLDWRESNGSGGILAAETDLLDVIADRNLSRTRAALDGNLAFSNKKKGPLDFDGSKIWRGNIYITSAYTLCEVHTPIHGDFSFPPNARLSHSHKGLYINMHAKLHCDAQLSRTVHLVSLIRLDG